MMSEFLEAGQIVNTHGVAGEVKIVPWADNAKFLSKFKRFFISNNQFNVHSARCHGENLIVKFEGIDSIDDAVRLKEKIICIARADVKLPEGKFFIADIIGSDVYDEDDNKVGRLSEVLEYPASKIYVVKKEDGTEVMVPAVESFVKKVDIDNSMVVIHFIEGM